MMEDLARELESLLRELGLEARVEADGPCLVVEAEDCTAVVEPLSSLRLRGGDRRTRAAVSLALRIARRMLSSPPPDAEALLRLEEAMLFLRDLERELRGILRKAYDDPACSEPYLAARIRTLDLTIQDWYRETRAALWSRLQRRLRRRSRR